ncbi:gag-pol polyprotein [Striga asiatica]|uniref:Gag-pol polyprotein n=1 Tax=Striga asiatica TaxID=4170 RepID=A0A5A7PS45_STRAF|nr:gag-pol polyprotein [Striga asiatica]
MDVVVRAGNCELTTIACSYEVSTATGGFPASRSSTAAGVSPGQMSGVGGAATTENSRAGGGPRCFSCGETGHRQSACPRRGGNHTLLAKDVDGDTGAEYDGPPIFDVEPEPVEEHLTNYTFEQTINSPVANDGAQRALHRYVS